MSNVALDTLKTAKKVIGAKQTARAVEKGLALKVYLAQDADRRVIAPLMETCRRNQIPIETGATMGELGKACGIEVGAASVAIVKEQQ
ncbi:ribosomal L7Ae/L30e/S12e/Gadd45 family protein [Methylomusa anaerophila]|uniref:ribosomal L7Ae/L30e/S12e/Gadd45 family protein n=1 Tax=Methylomusa anaerophila TaxID=1930071 RepID=UPI002D1FAC1E|nr:ribosomal L7Ae/L30e/S12e/Gadd45 family protein [Methylomusa anaerophila]